jgi:formamidopyrimidine-DNA glycosylase
VPELPEVEVLRRSLEKLLPGETIARVEVHSPKLREPLDRDSLLALEGRRVESLKRRAKYLLVELDGGVTLVIHLGMSGSFTVAPAGSEKAGHEHLTLHLGSGARLRLIDPRRFGLAFVVPTAGAASDRRLAHLGIEPLGPDFGGGYLAARIKGRKGPVKLFLMDGEVVVGVGNIYASESLWRAGIHPKRPVSRMAKASWEKLAAAVREVLEKAIAEGGTTLSDFKDGEGNSGYFQVSLAVYDREDKDCPRCGKRIARVVMGGRSTYYCTGCQR